MPKQQRRTFTTAFKKQMVQLYENGKSRAAIVEIFHKNRKVYGTRKIKSKLQEQGIVVCG